jgi:hypothetical protein
MRPKICLLGIIMMLAAVLGTLPASAQTKVALVIGNSAYRSVPALPNPAHDAGDIAASLERLGFSVRRLSDASYDEMRRGLLEFSRKASNAEMAVVFFAGHGMEVGGENWLVPVDAELRIDVNAEQEAIALRSVILAVSSSAKLGLVVLDACRNNPFLAKMNRTVLTRSVDRGLGRIEPATNVLVAYAAKDGTVAEDGRGRNSPFTTALLEHMETPGLEINFLFRNVRDEVVAATRGTQQPFVYGSLSKEAIYLKPPAATSALPGPDEVTWGLLKETTDGAALRRFAEQYPDSPLREQAQARMAALAAAQTAKPTPPSADEVTWAILRETNDEAALRRFAAQYPNSAYRQQAESRMAALAAQPPAAKPEVARTSESSPTSADFYTFTSALSTDQSRSADNRWCIDVPASNYQPGKSLSLFGCAGTPNQIFGFANRSNLTAGGLCLDGHARDRGKPPSAGDPVVLAECDGSDHQVWELEPFQNDPSLISLVAPSGLCVTVDGANAAPRTPLMLAQCDELKSQGWLAGDMARPVRSRGQQQKAGSPGVSGATTVGVYGEFVEDEYYWFDSHRYCWYDFGWRGPGWYWCGYGLSAGIGWGGPIGWHFWYHFGHKVLPHPIVFAAHLGKPAHLHTPMGNAGVQAVSGNKGNQIGKGEAHTPPKGDPSGKGEVHKTGKGEQSGKGDAAHNTGKGEQVGKGDTAHNTGKGEQTGKGDARKVAKGGKGDHGDTSANNKEGSYQVTAKGSQGIRTVGNQGSGAIGNNIIKSPQAGVMAKSGPIVGSPTSMGSSHGGGGGGGGGGLHH